MILVYAWAHGELAQGHHHCIGTASSLEEAKAGARAWIQQDLGDRISARRAFHQSFGPQVQGAAWTAEYHVQYVQLHMDEFTPLAEEIIAQQETVI